VAVQRVELRDFTAFERLELDFVPGVNVIIGENGTGKTHLLKVIYAVTKAAEEYDAAPHLAFKVTKPDPELGAERKILTQRRQAAKTQKDRRDKRE
jgi:recombinational DNA repair ATPase RecF